MLKSEIKLCPYAEQFREITPDPLPPRPKRKGSVLSLEEPSTDSDSSRYTSHLRTYLPKFRTKWEREGLKSGSGDQNVCSLLSRLPYEIRMMIYRGVLAGHVLHIIVKAERKGRKFKRMEDIRFLMGHIICSGCDCASCVYDRTSTNRWEMDTEMAHDDPCSCHEKWHALGSKTRWHDEESVKMDICHPLTRYRSMLARKKNSGGGLLSLLKTCRQIYREAIEILYSSNTFEFPHLGAIPAFKATILPERQAAIRYIQLRYSYYTCPCTGLYHHDYIRESPGWSPWWDIIAGDNSNEHNSAMTSLKEIRVAIPLFPQLNNEWEYHLIFKPMRDLVDAVIKTQESGRDQISVAVDFPIWVQRKRKEMADFLRKAPFLVLRTPRFVDRMLLAKGLPLDYLD